MTAPPPMTEPQSARDVVARIWIDAGEDDIGLVLIGPEDADRILAALATAGLIPSRTLIDATIALLWSHPEQHEILLGHARAEDFEPWPKMDAVMAELDAAAPGWRERAP